MDDLINQEWKENKKRKKAQMTAMQALPYNVKVKRAELRAIEYIEKLDDMGLNAHVSVGGLDSIVLLLFLRKIGIDVPAISVSSLEDKSIQAVHKDLGVIRLQSGKPKTQIPCDKWAKEHNSRPFLGLMASEGGQREEALVEHGCNYFGKGVIRSAPFAPFLRQDLLQLAIDLDAPVPDIYGEIARKPDGTLYTTKAQRTGCSMCGFGIHMEKRPHRFDQLRERNLKEWEFWMYRCCTDPATGEKYGWGRVLDYIGVEWEDIPQRQMSIFDFPEYLPERKVEE